ncbi:uncharacterized protein LOC112569555 isoform X2 [Pomacea canaliculata]|uniref:uncharacterized protein LOC112569555 isoform X2 n=1 Tax=Pomacea canaliculata TaxID=400727 RepID=UPI000D73B771|nr:uncharacterized protein LOC112569555 isoform X2 [Pomacea canaliculata]
MAAGVCRHSLLSRLSLIAVVVAHCLRAEDGTFREVNILQNVRQVACQHPMNGLVALTLQEAANTRRTVVTNPRLKSCVGNITYHGCFFKDTAVEVKVLIDVPQEELTTFICTATIDSQHGTDIKTVGSVNVTNTDKPLDSKSSSDESVDKHGKKLQNHQTSQEECAARNRIISTTAPSLEVSEVHVQQVKQVSQCQPSHLPPPEVRAPDAPVNGLVMQYWTPDNFSSEGP